MTPGILGILENVEKKITRFSFEEKLTKNWVLLRFCSVPDQKCISEDCKKIKKITKIKNSLNHLKRIQKKCLSKLEQKKWFQFWCIFFCIWVCISLTRTDLIYFIIYKLGVLLNTENTIFQMKNCRIFFIFHCISEKIKATQSK